ncbi:hypothetical protein [Nonomuraea jiangxiensis]|uniref:Uncharacterized protein n=1 Tax=Nonomuraea jiangxiensis TaxID=633440 RepID=A0A1G8PA92_9ACTN|nr:hypothetical protein [Nonomuraea jiangxiensis]SDI88660.1 hypothetical protein SAMN05421869_107360 [Nonomuraea jiangxiensis]
MDVEAEILELKLRLEALETTARSGGPVSGDVEPQRRHPNTPAVRHTGIEGIQPDITTTSIAVTEVKADIAQLHTEMTQDIAALNVEVTGLRWHLYQLLTVTRSEMEQKFDSLRCEMIELGLRLDRLLEKHGA